jgi:rod shape-determining protein MreC
VHVLSPVGRFLIDRNQTLRNAWINLASLGSLREDRANLQSKVITLQQTVIDNQNLRNENDALRKELGVSGVTRDLPKVFAHIIVKGDDNLLDYSFTVDVGSKEGVRVGQPVISQGALIGRVTEVRSQSSVVRAITSLSSGIQARLTLNQEKGYLVGTGNGVVLKDISQGLAVESGSVVETSGLGGSLPQGILIGTIDSLQSAKSELSQTFRIALPVDPLNIQSVLILLSDVP